MATHKGRPKGEQPRERGKESTNKGGIRAADTQPLKPPESYTTQLIEALFPPNIDQEIEALFQEYEEQAKEELRKLNEKR